MYKQKCSRLETVVPLVVFEHQLGSMQEPFITATPSDYNLKF